MDEDSDKYNPTFEGPAQGFAVGYGNIIYNYWGYRREEVISTPVDVDDENLPCPYQGLYHFNPQTAEYFFGRELFIEEIYKYTETRNFIPVLGASGSGKSSVILAGLVPKLADVGHWQFTHFRPGKDPFLALAQALVPLYEPSLDQTDCMAQARKLSEYFQNNTILLSDVLDRIKHNYFGDRILLIADQFEELYTLCDNKQTRQKFIDTLLNTFGSINEESSLSTVLVTAMRVDFLGNVLSYHKLADIFRNRNVIIRSMNLDELREVIEKPAQKLGVSFEEGLVETILKDVDKQPGILPLLEFALTELWQKREGKQLTHKAYEEIGQVSGALTHYADNKFSKLKEKEKEQVRRIFVQLVSPGAGTEDTRRVATKAELNETNWDLVKKLADARLVVTSRTFLSSGTENNSGQETVEVVHEALIKNWGQLKGWMAIDREFRSWQEQLRSVMRQWEANNRDNGSLLRGAALAKAEEKVQERPEELIAEEVFIRESIQERDRLKQEEAERQQRELETAQKLAQAQTEALQAAEAREKQQKRDNQKLRLGATFLGVLFLITLGTAGWAWNQTKEAKLNLADSLARTSIALLTQGKEFDALVKAIQARKILQQYQERDPEVMSALIANIYESSQRHHLQGHDKSVRSVSISNDGKIIVSGSEDKTIKVWNLETGKTHTLTGHDGEVWSVSITDNGKTIVSGSEDKTIKVWNLETRKGELIDTLTGHHGSVLSVSISKDGQTIVSGSNDKTIKVWNLETRKGELIHTLTGHHGPVISVNISNDGNTIVSGSKDKTIKVWNLETEKKLIHTLTGHTGSVLSVSISKDGKTIVSGSDDKTIKVWNLETRKGKLKGELIRTLTGHDSWVESVSISNDGKTIVSGSDDKTIKVWNLETGAEIPTLTGHDYQVNSVSISKDGKTIVSGSKDKTIKVWNLETGELIRTLGVDPLTGHHNWVESVSISNDGKTIVSGSRDKTIKVWNLEKGELIRTLGVDPLTKHHGWVSSLNISNDGKTIVSGSRDKTIKVWNLAKGELIRTLTGHDKDVLSISISKDGKTIVSGSYGNTIKVWNLETGAEIRTLTGHGREVSSVSISNDSKTIVSGSYDKTIKVWDLETGAEIRTLTGHDSDVYSVSISNDGKTIVSGSYDKTIKVWNIDLDWLIERGCNRIRNYLQNNPTVKEEDRKLCEGV